MHFFHGCECFPSQTKQKLKGLELTYNTAKRTETDVENFPPWAAILASLFARANDWDLDLEIEVTGAGIVPVDIVPGDIVPVFLEFNGCIEWLHSIFDAYILKEI